MEGSVGECLMIFLMESPFVICGKGCECETKKETFFTLITQDHSSIYLIITTNISL